MTNVRFLMKSCCRNVIPYLWANFCKPTASVFLFSLYEKSAFTWVRVACLHQSASRQQAPDGSFSVQWVSNNEKMLVFGLNQKLSQRLNLSRVIRHRMRQRRLWYSSTPPHSLARCMKCRIKAWGLNAACSIDGTTGSVGMGVWRALRKVLAT